MLKVSPPTPLSLFDDIFLVVHCRLGRWDNQTICEKRRPIVELYRPYFSQMVYITRNDCKEGDPYACLAKMIRGPAANSSGLFYMHFDALLNPVNLVQRFDRTSIAVFGRRSICKLSSGRLLNETCEWWAWNFKRKKYLAAAKEIRDGTFGSFVFPDNRVILGNDDAFYIPQKVFGQYCNLSDGFGKHDVYHELAGPTMLHVLDLTANVGTVNLECAGDCCTKLTAEIALEPGFRCGHSFNLSNASVRDVFRDILAGP